MALFRRGMHFGSYDLGASGHALFEAVIEAMAVAEGSGFDALSVPDHLLQNDVGGGPQGPMFEAYTLLGAVAQRTSRAQLLALVSPVTMRNPGLLAKCVTTLDVISGGRAVLGIGAGWDVDEHRAYGLDFPCTGERMDRLEEALQICRSLFTTERSSFTGDHFRLDGAWNSPRPVGADIPILVGGSGERRTLRLAARYADACNVAGSPDVVRRKLAVLDAHCAELGREPTTITKTAFIIPPADLGGFADTLGALVSEGIEGVVVMGSGDHARIEALGRLVGAAIP